MTIDIEQLKADRKLSPNFLVSLKPFQVTTVNARRIARVPDLEAEVIRLTERLRLYEGQESTPETPVGFDGMVSEMSGTIQHQTARIAALEAKVKAADELLGFIDAKISWEINPSNYDHQQVCEMNASWIEIGLAVAACREVQS